HIAEQLVERRLVLENPARHPHGVNHARLVSGVLLIAGLSAHQVAHRGRPANGPLDDPPQLLGFGIGGLDSLMLDERSDQVREERMARGRLSTKFPTVLLMAHRRFPLLFRPCRAAWAAPNRRASCRG